MTWNKEDKERPDYSVPVLAYVLCTCGCGYGPAENKSGYHKLNCDYDKYFIATFCEKDHQAKQWYDHFPDKKPSGWKYEDWWSPFKPDFWMLLPSKPQYRR